MGAGVAVSRGALIGSIISAAFAIGWCQWGALGITGTASIVVRIVGAVLGVVLIVRCIRARRQLRGDGDSGSVFATSGYWIVVFGEVVALAGGSAVLGATGRTEYQIAWFALVVGVHFLVFGKLFATRFYPIGAALVGAAVAGTVIGLAGGGAGLVEAVTGLVTAVSLFVPPILTIRQLAVQRPTETPAAS
jgi:hypothetical protein